MICTSYAGMVRGTSSSAFRKCGALIWGAIGITFVIANTVSASVIHADAVVLVNSTSPQFTDFQQHIQPYLDNFGIPYSVQDISTNPPGTSISNYALIVIGHGQLDTNRTFLTTAAQKNISLAVSNGTGLVNFDYTLSAGGAPLYQYVQDIFNFGYGGLVSGTNASLPATQNNGTQMHCVTARHPVGDSIGFHSSLLFPNVTLPVSGTETAIVLSGGHPLVVVQQYGQGRAVQWATYGWMPSAVLGPVEGMDDVVWRGMVWAARKPFVIRGMPNFVSFRVDDVSGPFWWIHTANQMGFKVWVGLILSNISASASSTIDLSNLVASGNATASVHTIDCCNDFFYYSHEGRGDLADNVLATNFANATLWHQTSGIPISKVAAAHYGEIGTNAFGGLLNWGVEFIPLVMVPGSSYLTNPVWLKGGPYRNYETPGSATGFTPFYYSDWVTVPNHPELAGRFYNVFAGIRDLYGGCGEWCPQNADVTDAIIHGQTMVRRGWDSLVMATLFTHEWWIVPIPQSSNQTPISSNNWYTILQNMTNNFRPYHPVYVTFDYHSQYARAVHTARLASAQYDTASGQVTAVMNGYADMDSVVYVYSNLTNGLAASYGVVPAFTNAVQTNVVAAMTLPLQVSTTGSNAVVVSWTSPLALSADTNISSLANPPPGFILQQCADLLHPVWSNATNHLTISGSQSQVVLAPAGIGSQFYRLMSQVPQGVY